MSDCKEYMLTARFEKGNLSNVEIMDCIIEGSSIDGILLTDLLEHYKRKIE